MNPTVITVLGTLAGTGLGLCGPLINSWMNHERTLHDETSKRRRERLEELYVELIQLKRDYLDEVGQVFRKTRENKLGGISDTNEMPPMFKIEMLIHLYAPELDNLLNEFQALKERTGKLWLKIITKDYVVVGEEIADADRKEYLKSYSAIEVSIAGMQQGIKNILET